MESRLQELDKLQAQINSLKKKYKEIIRNNHPFNDAKHIFLKIQELEKRADSLKKHPNNLQDG